ncbi:MAG: hypothetical protein IJT76_09390 [Clostridia bacterium]|nr:hypothetical protein [Clostridia bacterium]
MRNKKNAGEKPSIVVRLLSAVIVVMLLVAVITGVGMVSKLKEAYNRDEFSSIAWYAGQGDYGAMITQFRNSNYDVAPFDSQYAEEYQLAAYADAAFQKRYFESAGDETRTADLARRMEDARASITDLAPLLDEIDSIVAELPSHP